MLCTNHCNLGVPEVFGASWLHLGHILVRDTFRQFKEGSDFAVATHFSILFFTSQDEEWSMERYIGLTTSHANEICIIWRRFLLFLWALRVVSPNVDIDVSGNAFLVLER